MNADYFYELLFYFLYECVCENACHVCIWPLNPGKGLDSCELELKEIVSDIAWVLGIKLRLFGRAEGAANQPPNHLSFQQ